MSKWGTDDIVPNTNYLTDCREEYIKTSHTILWLCCVLSWSYQIEANIDSLWIIPQYIILA